MPGTKKIYLPLARQHVRAGARWAHEIGTDYWLHPSTILDQAGAASTATGDELAENGWVATSLVNTAGSAGTFGSSVTKGVPPHFLTNATADLLKSPPLFGTYWHMRAAADLAGMADLPRFLIARVQGAMTTHATDDAGAGWGFVEDGGTPATEADLAAWISSDGTNFQFGANAGTPVDLQADDASWHEFVIAMAVTEQRSYAWIDPTWRFGSPPLGTALGSVAIVAAEAPYAFGVHALTNDQGTAIVHIYYDW